MKRTVASIACAIAIVAVAACGGGSGSSSSTNGGVIPAQPTSDPRPQSKPHAVIEFHIPPKVKKKKRGSKEPAFVSGATEGAMVVALNAKTGQSATTVANLGPTSVACTGGSGTVRTCTFNASVWVGTNLIKVVTYDAAPQNGKIPSSAHILAVGSLTTTVNSSTVSIPIYLGGVIATIGAGPSFSSLPANGSHQQALLMVAPEDFGDQPITAGSPDPYHNPITVTLTESGGTGHAKLYVNGAATGSTARLTESSDSLELHYDGAGAPGYYSSIAFAASGASTQSLEIAPMYVTSTSSLFTASPPALTLLGTTSTADLTVQEAGSPPSTQAYTSTPSSGCGSVATSTTLSHTNTQATFSITGGPVSSASGCTITISDGTSSIVIPASNTTTNGTVTLPGSTSVPITDPYASPGPIAVGPGNDLWIGGFGDAQELDPTTGTITPIAGLPYMPSSLVTGPDGAVWFTTSSAATLMRVTTTGNSVSQYALPSGTAGQQIASGADGNLYVTDSSGNNDILQVSIIGATTPFTTTSSTQGVAAGPDDAIWFTEPSYYPGGAIGRLDLSTLTVSEYPTTGEPYGIAQGPDGAMWFTEITGNKIGRITTDGNHTITSYPIGTGETAPKFIVAGPDAAMWFTQTSSDGKPIGHITVSSDAVTSYALGGSAPVGIVTGPDGYLWITQGSYPGTVTKMLQ